ncbi:Cell wall protein ecm33 [Symbiodinium microadriaticum]|uniref:Cell wall protein ecm33 n=1 Tax=Symbiodinium microadriaticum TaxID=2951 RepID=A0A1Q9CBH3_SYMMI|nr:Cell wall protein ecm33 [Symbiodinium microadriaticum]
MKFNSHGLTRLVSFQLLWSLQGEDILGRVSCGEREDVSADHPNNGTAKPTSDTSLLQIVDQRRQIPPDCFLLEDYFHVDPHGTLVATLRFGPGGNAGPNDVRCIGSNRVKEIVGSLDVTGALSLTSVLLPTLETVRGSLIFLQLPQLASQAFSLDALTRVDENLVIRHSEALSTVPLQRLREVGRTLEVRSNQHLELLWLNRLTFVGLHLLIESNPSLSMIAAPSLKAIRFDFIIGANGLQQIELEVLEEIGEDLVVYNSDSLRSIGLPLLSSIGEDAEFIRLLHLRNLSLPALKSIGEDLEVLHCYSLEAISMPSLDIVQEDVELHHLPLCSSVSLPRLSQIAEDLEMYSLVALTAVVLPSLEHVREDLFLGGMPAVLALSMPQLSQVGGSFWLYNMPNLVTADFTNLAQVGGIKVQGVSRPPSRSKCYYGLGNCEDEDIISEDAFYITNNTRLEHVWLPNLASISCRYFAIFGNAALASVRLPRLTTFSHVPQQNVSNLSNTSLSSLFAAFGNGALLLLELNPNLPEPEYWTFDGNALGFCPSGPQWAISNCSGGTISVEDAEAAIFGDQCKEAGFEDGFLDGFCRQAQCPSYAPRNMSGTCPGCYDASGCLVLSRLFVTVPDLIHGGLAINGSILLSSDDPALLGVQCIKAGDNLTSINGCTEIVGSTSLQAVDLEQVRVAGFSVTLSGNSALHAVAAASLAKVHLDLVLEGNMALEGVDFPGLQMVSGRFSLRGNGADGAQGLKSLEFLELSSLGSFFLASNTHLQQLRIPSLSCTQSHIRIVQLNKIRTIDLPSLKHIGEDFTVSFCWSLTAIRVPGLTHIDEDLELYVLHSLEALTFPRLMQVGEDLELYTNDALTSIQFSLLEVVGEDLEVFDNTQTFDVDQASFPNLKHVDEDFEIYACAQLEHVDVPQLAEIGEDLLLFGNARLRDLSLPMLEDVAVREGGGMLITDNLALYHLDLPSLRRCGNSTARIGSRDGSRDIRLYTGASRREVQGQEARPVLIAHNPKLTRIGLPQLEVLNTGLWIQKNDQLKSIRLESLRLGLGNQFFVIRLNPVLGKGGLWVPRLENIDGVPALVNLNCNSRDFCVQRPGVSWLRPWSCWRRWRWWRLRSCPDPYFANRWCGRSPAKCTHVFYEWAMENSYDFEENVIQPWVSPSRFAAYYKAARKTYRTYR